MVNKDKSQVDTIFTDFFKAFNSVDHGNLIHILDKLGIGNLFLSWFHSYVTDRWQFVNLFGVSFKRFMVTTGIPQGGHLSPLLFIPLLFLPFY